MAGLVDYGVDSDRESNDSPNHESSSLSRKQTDANPQPDDAYHRTKGSSSSKESKSSKSGHSKEVHKSSSSISKNKSNDRHHKHHKRSRSRSRDRSRSSKKRSRSRDRKDRHRDERKKKRRSKSRSRSRSRSRSTSLSRKDRKSDRRTRSQERREKKAATIARMGLDVTNVAASLVMPSAESKTPVADMSSVKQNPHFTSSVAAASSSAMSAAVQAAAQQVLQSRVAEAQQVTGVTLPSFYNPAAVNPMKYAQQIQKRKLLWANKEKTEPPTTAKLWEATAFTQDQDGKMTAKFKRLMGIKNDPSEGGAGPSQAVEDRQPESSVDVLKKQQELFASLDQQYQVARATTHTQRGLGLGFGSSSSSYPR
uniref:EOG090X0LFN n=1 Tax=Daphnia pulicaria TaxID=35523 RepID=A0A4Y7MZ80_9CRUS|nr:EOG090X0LFN [Daphnia pulicaria]